MVETQWSARSGRDSGGGGGGGGGGVEELPPLLALPGTYRGQADSFLIGAFVRALAPGRRVLDVCTGSGMLALVAALAGAAEVTAVDLSLRAALSARVNAARLRTPVRVRRGDLFAPVAGERFDLVVCNPPYVPSATDRLPRHAVGRSWDGGVDGRCVVDRFCAEVGKVLAPGGRVLLVHSSVIGVDQTLRGLSRGGLDAAVVADVVNPFGPVMRAREQLLRERRVVHQGQRHENLVVVDAHLGQDCRPQECRAAG